MELTENIIKSNQFSLTKLPSNIPSEILPPFYPGLDELNHTEGSSPDLYAANEKTGIRS